MPDYKNGKIYTIRYRGDDSLIYVGSTCNDLAKRWWHHKSMSKCEKSKDYNKLLYQKIRETNIEDWYIELYEDCPCDDKNQLNRREGEIIRQIGTLNKEVAGRTCKEWHKENYTINRNKILEKQSQKITCQCGKVFRYGDKTSHIRTQRHQEYIKFQEHL